MPKCTRFFLELNAAADVKNDNVISTSTTRRLIIGKISEEFGDTF